MSEMIEVIEKIKQSTFDLLSQVQTTKVVDDSAYNSICENTDKALILMHGKQEVPRALLKEIFFASEILKVESVHMGADKAQVKAMAEKLEEYFRLIIIDEMMS